MQTFCTQCDQAMAHDASIQAYVRQLEQDYDATGDEAHALLRDEDLNPEKLMQELEDFARGAGRGRVKHPTAARCGDRQGDRILSCSGEHLQEVVFVETT